MDLGVWLRSLGLDQYEAKFRDNKIDADVLPRLTADDLKDIGVSAVGDRRRLLDAIVALTGATPEDTSHTAPKSTRIPTERRQITVMFADLVDSTKLAARLDPEDLKDVIAKFQRAVANEVRRFGGHVAKPLGDGLLIYFGWPRAHEDDAERAARSALAAVAAVRRLTSTEGAALASRIGLATGEVVVGDFVDAGISEDGAVVGQCANLAARLQSVADENSVLVAEGTFRLLSRQFSFADLGQHPLKGFASPIRVWRIDAERTSESRFEAMRDGRLSPFVGREHEMGVLRQRWEEVAESGCQLAVICGEAGIGKSRIVSEFMRHLEGGVRRITLQASPLHTNTALYPVVRNLEFRAGFRAEDNLAEKRGKLNAAILSQSPRRAVALQFLAQLMSLESPQEAPDQAASDVAEQRETALDFLADMMKSETDLAPLVFVVEDAHWLDATTIELIEHILDRLRGLPAMALITHRPEFEPPWKQHANVATLALNRLGRRDAKTMLSALSGGRNVPPGLEEEILAKSDGIPLFVEELTSVAFEAAEESSDRNIQIPPTLRDSMSERLDRLGAAKEVAQVASALGREFSASLVAATLGRSEDELESELDQLRAIDVIFQSSRAARRYTFQHALLQEAAYESMLRGRRREVHSRIAETLMRVRPTMAETEPEVLAAHFARAGDTARAADYWRRAGRLAQRNSAYREAIGAFKSALALMSKREKAFIEVSRAVASAYFAIGDYESNRKHLAEAAAAAEDGDDQVLLAEIAMQQSHVLNIYGGDLEDAFRFGRRALDIAVRLDDEGLAYGARFALGQTGWIGGDYAAAIQFLTANLPENVRDMARVRDFGAAGSLLVDSMSMLGSTLAHCGEFERGLTILQRAKAIPTENAFDLTVVSYHLGRAHLYRGEAHLARPISRAAIEHATAAGLKFSLPWHLANLGYAMALLGEVETGVQLLNQAREASQPMHLPYLLALSSVLLAETIASRQPEQALEVAESALGVARAVGYRAQEAELLRVKAAALVGVNPNEGEATAKEGLALARKVGLGPEEGHALRTLGDISAARGDGKVAAEFYEVARAKYRSLGMAHWEKTLT
jgi:class 3 adenylate cyclase/tetratricopeptide (TPR) repeat protein